MKKNGSGEETNLGTVVTTGRRYHSGGKSRNAGRRVAGGDGTLHFISACDRERNQKAPGVRRGILGMKG